MHNQEMSAKEWAVTSSASGVQATGAPGYEDEEWPLMASIHGVGPDGSTVAATPTGTNMVIFDPELPPGSKIYAGDILLTTVSEVPELPTDTV